MLPSPEVREQRTEIVRAPALEAIQATGITELKLRVDPEPPEDTAWETVVPLTSEPLS